jgi:NAD(P)-dependent dehydrogenase (short-subunit alcohol dehydrogenase family)/enamine deaminase RidA (YjgF/YER057c/UK114 family)
MPDVPSSTPAPEAALRPALVTGAGRGIGRAVAAALAGAGHRVVLISRTKTEIEAAASDIAALYGPGRATAIPCDVTDPASVDRLFETARSAAGEFGVLVNAAGAAESAPYTATGDEMLRRLLSVNLMGAHHMMRRFLPSMISAGGGSIVNVGSTASLQGFAYASAYAASKHALLGLTRSVALEVSKSGVRVNAVCPAFVDTPLLQRSAEEIASRTGRTLDAAREALAALNPAGRLLTPQEVADAIVWLIEGEGSKLSGEALVVDGRAAPWMAPEAALPVNPEALGPPSGYSNGMILRAGRTLFVAGQVAWDRDHVIQGGNDFAAQFDVALGNVVRVVNEAGGHAEQIGRMRIYVCDRRRYLAALREIGRAYRRHMGTHYPAMALVEVAKLLEEGALVEIEAEAIL